MTFKPQTRGTSPSSTHLESHGFWWSFLGVLAFSFSLPMTRLAAPIFGGFTVGMGRAVVAGILACAFLYARREPMLERQYWLPVALTALGVVVGFPVFSSLALQLGASNHASIINGLLPAVTAVFAVSIGRERPSLKFWAVFGLGVLTVLGFAVIRQSGLPAPADALMLVAVAFGALGYFYGGRLAVSLGGWRVISWALVFALPITTLAIGFSLVGRTFTPTPEAWIGFAYVSLISMFLGFFAWYKGMAMVGVAKSSQVQLAQLPLALLWSTVLLGEPLDALTIVCGAVMVAVAFLSRLTRVTR
jgi:drug/metabolite transporter (DMT)-like permease